MISEAIKGIAGGGAVIAISLALSKDVAPAFLAVFLGVVAGVYGGFALLDGRRRECLIEICGMALFLLLGMLGLWVSSSFLAAGWLLHGLWDILHHPRAIRTKLVTWYPPLCMAFDFIIGLFILFRWP